jgi:hypothetical protein
MGLFAMAITTGSIAQDGGITQKGLSFTWISSSGMNPTGLGTSPLVKTDYRPLAKSRLAEDNNIFLLVSNTDAIPNTSAGAYWEDVTNFPAAISGTLGLLEQRPYFLPRYKGVDERSFAVDSTSSWQWVDGLDQTIKAWNDANPGSEYYPRGYGWILGVEKNGTPGGWNVKAYFWGVTGSNDAASEASFVSVVNSLPIGAYQTTANIRAFSPTQGNDALQNVFFNTYFDLSGTDGNVANYVVVQNRGNKADPNDVGKPNLMAVVTGSIF